MKNINIGDFALCQKGELGLILWEHICIDFALCQKGELGLILWEHICIEKRTNRKYILYHGINLTSEKIGKNWQSKNPTKVNKNYIKKQFKAKI